MNSLSLVTFGVYASVTIMLCLAAILLSNRRGLSILAVYASSVALQPMLLYGVIQDYPKNLLISNKAMLDMGLSFMIFSWIMIGFMLRQYRKSKRSPISLSLDMPIRMRRSVVTAISILASLYIIWRVLGPSGRLVLDFGIEALFSEDYYYLRSGMIDIGLSSYSRSSLLFSILIRTTLLVTIIVGLYSVLRYRQSRCLSMIFVTVFCFSVTLLDSWFQYEKLHIVMLLVSCTVVIVLSRQTKIASTFGIMRTSAFVAITGLLLSTGAYMLTQGFDFMTSMMSVFERIALVPGRATGWYFEIYPRLDDFSWYSTSRTVRWLFDTGHLAPQWGSLAQDVAYMVSGSVYDANVALPGEAWANGGYLVVGAASLVIGFIFTKLDGFTMKRSRRTNLRPLPMIYLFFVPIFGNAGFSAILTSGIVLVPFIVLSCFTVKGSTETRPSRGSGCGEVSRVMVARP